VLELLHEMSLTIKGRLDERHFQARPLNLPALCIASINEIRETVGAKHRFKFQGHELVKSVQADETLLSRILLNLLSNAVKFSPEGSEIRVELILENQQLCLKVYDEGMGISPEDMGQIFAPFFRAEAARSIRGTGLGLNIVQDCVERHQGQIQVASVLGEGTCFTVTIPYFPA
jgi:signal transduction histidine kinase